MSQGNKVWLCLSDRLKCCCLCVGLDFHRKQSEFQLTLGLKDSTESLPATSDCYVIHHLVVCFLSFCHFCVTGDERERKQTDVLKEPE